MHVLHSFPLTITVFILGLSINVASAIETTKTIEIGLGLTYESFEENSNDSFDQYLYGYGQLEARGDHIYGKTSGLFRNFFEDQTLSILDAYIGFSADESFTDIGKRRIQLGYGFIGSPLDRYLRYPVSKGTSREEILQFSEGQYMMYHERFTDFGVFGLGYVPRISFSGDQEDIFGQDQQESVFLSYNHDINGINITALLGHEDKGFYGLGFSSSVNDQTEWHAEALYDNDINVGSITGKKTTSSNVRLLTGITHFFDNQSLLFEFQYNSDGNNNPFSNNMFHSNPPNSVNTTEPIATFSGGNSLGKKYAVVRHFTRFSNKLELTEYVIANLSDDSAMLAISCDMFPIDNMRIRAQVRYNHGDSGSEYSSSDSNLKSIIELRWSF